VPDGRQQQHAPDQEEEYQADDGRVDAVDRLTRQLGVAGVAAVE
jgi:hypothetical protein